MNFELQARFNFAVERPYIQLVCHSLLTHKKARKGAISSLTPCLKIHDFDFIYFKSLDAMDSPTGRIVRNEKN